MQNDYWLNAPTFAPLDAPAGGTLRKRNERLSDLLGQGRPEVTYEQNMAKMRQAFEEEPSGHSSEDTAVAGLGLFPEGD